MHILGISAYYHDAAACLLRDGDIVAAAQEERFTRKKHDPSFPNNSISYCLAEAKITPSQVDYIVFYDKPFLKFERLIETYLAFAPKGFSSFVTSLPIWLKDKLFQRSLISKSLSDLWGNDIDWSTRLLFSEHHLSHAASAFFPSPFNRAAVLTMDGVGEWTTTSLAVGSGNRLSVQKEIHFPHSLGLLYSAITYYLGFRVNSGEYKVMGLAPYGEAKYASRIKDHLIDIKEDGSFALDMSYFNYCTGLTMTNEKFDALFGGPARKPESMLTQREMDIAASVQLVIEEAVIALAKGVAASTGERYLCLAGGVALNCVANGKLLREGVFDRIWIQPAAGDAGGALGAALGVYHIMLDQPRRDMDGTDAMKGSYLGPQYAHDEIKERLTSCGAVFSNHTEDEVVEITARALAEGKAVGWHVGRMEFGPRALGARSILADPRSPKMQKQLNLKVKYRESFRPFAPSVLREDVATWFEIDVDSPYMLLVADVVKEKRKNITAEEDLLFGIDKLNVPRSEIPAVTHVDYSARVQTVHEETNPLFYKLIKKFKSITGCPVLVNTSFNVRGEPIVSTPEDAFRCFMGTELNLLVVGNCILEKESNQQVLQATRENKTDIIEQYKFLNPSLSYKANEEINIVTIDINRELTRQITSFYADAPFPNYEEFESIHDLITKVNKNVFLRSLKDEIGLGKRFIEVGSGTCQLSLALAFNTNNEFVALDPTIESLELGYKFARKNNIENVKFVNADIFDNPITDGYFDIVWSSGVLHHTENPKRAHQIISKWVKPGGLIIIGLYNKYGRLWTVLRQMIYRTLLKSTFAEKIIYLLDPYLRKKISVDKKVAWFRDQYIHPRESLHTLDEVLAWFDSESIEYVGSIPSCSLEKFQTFGHLSSDKGTVLSRVLAQISMLFNSAGAEGGLFIVVGRKKSYLSAFIDD